MPKKTFYMTMVVLAVIPLILLTGCCSEPAVTNPETIPQNTTPTTAPEELPLITPEQRSQLREGMTLEEVREILGYSGKDVASGTIVYVYEMTTGESLEVCFIGSRDGFIVTGIHTIEE